MTRCSCEGEIPETHFTAIALLGRIPSYNGDITEVTYRGSNSSGAGNFLTEILNQTDTSTNLRENFAIVKIYQRRKMNTLGWRRLKFSGGFIKCKLYTFSFIYSLIRINHRNHNL